MSTAPAEDNEGYSDFLSWLGVDDNTSSPPTTVASSVGASQTQHNINNANDVSNTVAVVEPAPAPAPVVPVSTTTTTTTTPQPIDVEKGIVSSSPPLPVAPQSSTVPNDASNSNQVPTPFWTGNRKFAAAAVGLLAAIIVIVGAAVGVSSSKKGAEPSEVVVTVDVEGDVPKVLEEDEDNSEEDVSLSPS